ncbi:MAG: trypsin-like peptidase domain-containing protein [Cyanobacteria bacterium HKST-UBA01]|nr:trypsin-like peptidase domain-containing protein [Cyanobacteria bacterium HKST-UBA01]
MYVDVFSGLSLELSPRDYIAPMAFDSQCPAPTGQEVPTLRLKRDADPCDRTDYSLVKDQVDRVGTSSRLHDEIAESYKELVETDRKFKLNSRDADLREASKLEPEMAYDLNQYRIASPGVFRIDSREAGKTENRGLGTGFAVRQEGNQCQIMTDYHVVTTDAGDLEPNLTVKSRDGKRAPATLKAQDVKSDLALLSVPVASIGSCPVLPLGKSSASLHPGADRVATIGHAGGAEQQFLSGGYVIHNGRKHSEIENHPDGKTKPWKDNQVVEVAAHVIGGNSGGPAMADGAVVGATQYKRATSEMFFTPVEDIRALIAKANPFPILRAAPVPRDIPLSCTIAKEEIRAHVSRGELLNGNFNERRHIYRFKDGSVYTLNQSPSSCIKTLPGK